MPENEYLLKKVLIKGNPHDLSNERFMPYVKQKENVRIFGTFKFHLGLYNMAGKDTSKKFNKWLGRIGEAPVLYDELLADQTANQLEVFLRNKGYFHARVKDSLVYVSKKKIKVRYEINEGKRFRLNQVAFSAEDSVVEQIVLEEIKHSLLKKGKPFDVSVHDAERERITRFLRNKGYYDFSKEFIYFRADSSLGSFQINDSVIIKNVRKEISRDKDTTYVHSTFRIKDVYYRMGYDSHMALSKKDDYFAEFDTLLINDCHFLYRISWK